MSVSDDTDDFLSLWSRRLACQVLRPGPKKERSILNTYLITN